MSRLTLPQPNSTLNPSDLVNALSPSLDANPYVPYPQPSPLTLFSDTAKRAGYDRSLFERLTQTGHPSVLLDTQYRMTPSIRYVVIHINTYHIYTYVLIPTHQHSILFLYPLPRPSTLYPPIPLSSFTPPPGPCHSAFPNHSFYHGRLRDGQNVQETSYGPPFLADPVGNTDGDVHSSNSSSSSSSSSGSGSSLPASLLKFMVLDLQTSLDSGSDQSNHSAPAIPPVKFSSQISTGQSNLPSQISTAVASISTSLPSTSLTNSEEALLCVRVVETLITQARASGCATTGSIGIITFYADQVGEIKRKLQLSGMLTASSSGIAGNSSSSSSGSSSSSSSGGAIASANVNASVSVSITNYLPGASSSTGGHLSVSAPVPKKDPATTLDIEVR